MELFLSLKISINFFFSQVNEEKQEIDVDVDRDENALYREHERLATEYKNESALLKEALKKSTDPAPTILEEDEQETEFNGEPDESEKTSQNRAVRLVPTKVDFSTKPVSFNHREYIFLFTNKCMISDTLFDNL